MIFYEKLEFIFLFWKEIVTFFNRINIDKAYKTKLMNVVYYNY